MEATTQLALMAKAKIVFGGEGRFLSFPLSQLQFTRQQLDFMADLNISNLIEFTSLVNQIPTGEVWLAGGEHNLDDVYQEILEQGIVAESTRTAEEEAEYQSVCIYLQSTPGQDSVEFKTYKQYKDLYITASQSYATAQATAESSADPIVKQKWEEVDKSAFRGEIIECEKAWVVEGYKNQVDNAINKKISLGAKFPSKTWDEWKSRIIRDIDTATDAKNLQEVYPASFSPTNALDEASWQPFTITGDEVRKLISEGAPGEMLSRLSFGLGDVDPSIDSLSFEFSSATIIRPWLKKEAFETRFWKFSDPSKVLSDGAMPASGICPAYVTAVVFARNLKITKSSSSSPPPPISPNPINWNLIDKVKRKVQKVGTQIQTPISDLHFPIMKMVMNKETAPTSETLQTNTLMSAEFIQPIALERASQPEKLSVVENVQSTRAMVSRMAEAVVNHEDTSFEMANTTAVHVSTEISTVPAAQFRMLEGESFSRIIDAPTMISRRLISSSPEVDENIYILAFICKSLPKCPNPDPALQWAF
jgi:hypothetical protein